MNQSDGKQPRTDTESPAGDRLENSITQPDTLPVAPGLSAVYAVTDPDVIPPRESGLLDNRTVFITATAMVIALGAGLLAQVLIRLISFFTNLAFYGRVSLAF